MIIDIAPDALPLLCILAEAEVHRHKPRTPARRAASALWAALVTSGTVDGARKALDGFTDAPTRAHAVRLLHQIAAQAAATEG